MAYRYEGNESASSQTRPIRHLVAHLGRRGGYIPGIQDKKKVKEKKGFTKIQETCRIAASHGLEYAWVDTCCIDKSSSAELSESINSMFRWYKQSSSCIVFLSDLPPSSKPDVDFARQFPKCRWLTRGFTLQELIASREVRFYDSAWNFRGDKRKWISLVSDTTGIDLDVLRDPTLLPLVPVGRRMSWAARRDTTKEEDRAYCLLGIFDVNMPLIYGEGRKAFARLQEEIAKKTSDLTLFAWRQVGQFPPYRGVLAESPAEFAHCGSLKHKFPDADLTHEYAFTNKGLRIDTALITFASETQDHIWNLVCTDADCRVNMGEQGYLGVFLTKTALGFVRAQPDILFEASTRQHDQIVTFGTFYMKTHLDIIQVPGIDSRFEKAVSVIHPDTVRIVDTAPGALWDPNRSLFLNYGQGINGYVSLQLCEGSEPETQTRIIAAFSTIARPICVILQQGDPDFGHVEESMTRSKALAQIVTVDCLLDQPKYRDSDEATTEATTYITDSSSGMTICMQVALEEHMFERQGSWMSTCQQGYALNIQVSRVPVETLPRHDTTGA